MTTISTLSTQTIASALKDVAGQISEKITRLKQLLNDETAQQFEIGDGLIDLVDNCGCKLSFLSDRLGRPESTLSQYISTARDFPEGVRRYDQPFFRHLAVRMAVRRVEARAARSTGKPYTIDLATALDKVVVTNLKKQHDMVKLFRDEARVKLLPDAVLSAGELSAQIEAQSQGVINNCHPCDYRDLLTQLPDRCIQIAHLDPPYADYAHANGISGGIASLGSCDNDSQEAALKVTVAAFPLLSRTLAEHGVILLWQASSNALRPQLYEAFQDAGFECDIVVVWNKVRPQPGYPDDPWTLQTEFMYVLKRQGESLVNYDGSDRANLLNIAPVIHNRASLELTHAYQKPIALCKLLVNKHSQPGHIVVDCFGCSGEFAIAAHQLGRKWVYCESNSDNYEFGLRRIIAATAPAQVA